MKKLLKQYELNSDMSYFELIVDDFINWNITDAISKFKAMPKVNKISFLHGTTIGSWQSGLSFDHLTKLFYSL